MTINPKVGMWFSLAAAIISVLLLCGAEFTTIFGATKTATILAALGIFNAIVNGINGVLHMIPSQDGPAGAAQFPLGPEDVNGLVRFGLGLAQVPSDLIGDIDKALPGAAALIADAKGMEDDLKALEPLIEQAMPIIERLLPKLKAAYPNAVALLPVAEKVIAFVSDKKA